MTKTVNGYKIGPWADLCGANLHEVNLHRANLHEANLRGANLRRAYLRGADLRGADLLGADLLRANLHEADLRWADLRGANLHEANLHEANLEGAKLPHFQIPDGDLIGWKKVQSSLVKLRVPSKAKRTASLVGRKCRAEFAEVLWIKGGEPVETRGVVYQEGEIVRPDSYDDDPRVECTHGIHFFLTRVEAEEW